MKTLNSTMEKVLYNTAVLTFEELGFLLPTVSLSASQNKAPLDASIRVDFLGKHTGCVIVRLYGGLLPILATNMLGEMTPPSMRIQHDALGEVANVLCGNILPLVTDSKEVFDLTAPQLINEADIPSTLHDPVAVTQVGLEDGRAEIDLFMN